MDRDIYRSEPEYSASLMRLEGEESRRWRQDELADILQHQLRAPLLFDLRGCHPDTRAPRGEAAELQDPALASFRDLLRHPKPPLAILELTKEFSKASDVRSDDPLPTEIATILYYAVIVVAWLRHAERITTMSAEELAEGIKWFLRQTWLDYETRTLLREGLEVINSEAAEG